jgi:hypothetical protein
MPVPAFILFLKLLDLHVHILEPCSDPENQKEEKPPGLGPEPFVKKIPHGQADKRAGHEMNPDNAHIAEDLELLSIRPIFLLKEHDCRSGVLKITGLHTEIAQTFTRCAELPQRP